MGNDARQRAWAHAATGNNRLFLLAVAEFIQDGRNICWPSIKTLSDMVGVGERQIQRIARALEEEGAIVTAIGRGRKHTTTYGLLAGLSDEEQTAVIRDVKGDIAMSPINNGKGDIAMSPINNGKGDIKPDIAMSPLILEKVTSGVEKVTSEVIKGDIAMSPEPKGTEIRTERDHGGTADPLYGLMFAEVARICQIDLKVCTKGQRMQVAQTSKALRKAGKMPEEIPKFERWWYSFDWRGKKGDAPRPAQIQEVWQQSITHQEYTNGTHNLRQGTGRNSERGPITEADRDKW